jgi:hypothetical protein
MAKPKPKFTPVSSSEVRLDYRGKKFLLRESDRGFYGAGRSVGLYVIDDNLDRKFLKSIGWTKPDSQPSFNDDYLKGIVTWSQIKAAAVEYLDKIM